MNIIKKMDYWFQIKSSERVLNILFYSDSIVRFVYDEDLGSTPAVLERPLNGLGKILGDSIATNELVIKIDSNSLQVEVYNSSGELINKDISVDIPKIEIRKEILWERGFYGSGERYWYLNQKGRRMSNWNSDLIGLYDLHNVTIKEMHTSIPFYIGLDKEKCYGIYFDNSFRTCFDYGKTYNNAVSFKSSGGKIDYYLIYDRDIKGIIEKYSFLTGRMNLPSIPFLGYQQSRYSYKNSKEVMNIAKRMRNEKIPCDVLYLDIHYMENYKVFTIDSKEFRDFKKMLKELKSMGFKVVLIIDPGIKVEKGYKVFEEGKKGDYYVKDSYGLDYVGEVWPGEAVFPDFLRTEVRKWWGDLHASLIKDGVDGIWNDMNEPSNFITKSKTLPEDCLHIDDLGDEKTHSEIHNLYGLLEAKATYKGLKKYLNNKRPFLLTRAAFAGIQRYSALWTGDNTSVWEHLEMSIPMFLNIGLSGIPFVGSDVGGFLEDSDEELLCRWTQLGVFTPFFRNHSNLDTIYQEPWQFGEDTLDNVRKFINIRYSLLTYLYNLMKVSSEKGHPIMRPLLYHYQDDEKTLNIYDEFLFGENMLVAPIYRPGIDERLVYLPEGNWYDFWTDEKKKGKRFLAQYSPIDKIPVCIKEGSIIPRDKIMNYFGELENEITLHFYTGKSCEYELYIDDGITFDYEKDIFSLVKIHTVESSNTLIIGSKTAYKNYEIPKIKINLHGLDNIKEVIIDGEKIDVNNLDKILFNLNERELDIQVVKC